MTVTSFLAMLRDRGIEVSMDGDQLRCNAPAGTLTPELRAELRQRKHEILHLLNAAQSLARQQRAIVPIQPRGSRPPVFAIAGHNGDVFCFRALARSLGEDQPFYGLQPPGLDGHKDPFDRIQDLAEYFASEIRAFQPAGPCVIVGYCAGGTPAFELARVLHRKGATLNSLSLFGAPFATAYRRWPRLRKRIASQLDRLLRHARAVASLPASERRQYLAERIRNRRADSDAKRRTAREPMLAHRARVERATFAALRRYIPGAFPGRLCLYLPCKAWAPSGEEPLRWRSVARRVETYFGPDGCDGDLMLREPYAPVFADLFRRSHEGNHSRAEEIDRRPMEVYEPADGLEAAA
ncbi:MAG TPA: thioesterase domain-containing protein [Verrucomicrobiae bacterium]